MNDNKILIRGTGALACLFAARLAAAGIQVNLLGTWGKGLKTLSKQGVSLIEANGNHRIYPVIVSCNPKDFLESKFALFLVKSYQTKDAGKQLAECLSEDGIALTLQNGIGNQEKLSNILGRKRVAVGVTSIGATLLGPGRVREGGTGIIQIGKHPKLDTIIEWLKNAGFEIHIEDDINSLLWSKLILNAAINPVSALIKVTNGELINRKTARDLLIAAIQESKEVADALGISTSYSDLVAALYNTLQLTANNRSSMLQDIERGAPTEIDAICGEIVKNGEQVGTPTPINRTLWQLVKAM